MRRTIKLTNRQAEMVLAMFVGNEKIEHYTNEEIRELVTLIWEWQWGVGRSLLKAIGSPHEPTYLAPEAAGAVADRQDTGGNIVRDANGQAKVLRVNEARRIAVDVARLPQSARQGRLRRGSAAQ
jgi:hypothetical protein